MIGSNVSTVGGIAKAFIQANRWKAECIQIYTTPSRSWKVPKRSAEDIGLFCNARAASGGLMTIAHVPFLANLASGDSEARRRSVQRLIIEMESAEELGIDRIVLHPGSSVGYNSETGIKRIAEGIEEVFLHLPQCNAKLLLETMAGQGSEVGSTFDELAAILALVPMNERIGICFDTCHTYASGYDIRGYHGFAKVMDEFDKILGIHRIGAFHLNDSRYPLASRVDRHCSIGRGLLGLEVFQAIVSDKRFDAIAMIVENPDRDRESLYDLTLLKELRANTVKVVDPPLPDWAASKQLALLEMNDHESISFH